METRRFTILHRGGDPKARLPGYVRYPESVLEVADLLGPQQPQRGEVLGRVLDRSQLDDRAGIDLVRAVGLRWIDFVLQHLDHVPLAHYLKSIRTQMDLLRSRAKRKCALTRFDSGKAWPEPNSAARFRKRAASGAWNVTVAHCCCPHAFTTHGIYRDYQVVSILFPIVA